MERNNRYMSMLRIVLLFVVGILLQVGHVAMGQIKEYGAQISDGSTPPLQPITFSILELNSKERGFLMPRMTTIERDRMVAADLTEGMTIYNLTLDCIEFYNGTRKQWMNVCGGSEPAVYVIPELKCGTIKVNGDYMAGVLLNERTHNLIIEVNVSTPGAFDVEAIAYDDAGQANGYVFTTSGVFPTAGDFVLVLKGKGTPKKGYASGTGKDTVKFKLNKKEVGCTVNVDVAKGFEPLAASMDCTKATALGAYKINVPLTETNVITVDVTVTKNGRGRIFGTVPLTGGQNETIKYESKVIDFSTKNSPVKVELRPTVDSGKPNISGPMKMNLRLETRGKHEYDFLVASDPKDIAVCSFNIDVESDGPKYNMGAAILKSTFMTTLKTKDKNGNAVKVGIPYITPKTDMTANGGNVFRIELTIQPIATGHYIIKTKDKNNGIWFEGEGDITQADVNAGIKTVILKAYGVSETDLPNAYGRFEFIGNNIDPNYTNKSSVFVDFVYRPMDMYSVGGGSSQSWHPGGNSLHATWSAGPRMVRQYKHFSWDGVVRIAQLRIIDVADFYSQTSGLDNEKEMSSTLAANSSAFSDNIDLADMVFIGGNDGGNFIKRPAQLKKLVEYVKGTGVLVYGEGSNTYLNSFYQEMGMVQSATNNTTTGTYTITNVVTNRNKLILGSSNEYFSKGDAPNGIKGLNIGGHSTGTQVYLGVPASNITSLAGTNGNFSFIHDDYGLVVVGSSAFMGGFYDDGGSNYHYPTTGTSTGTPLKRNFDGRGSYVYNSFFLLNLVHWAIDYAQEHQYNRFKP